jgi:hypothetical protein
MRLKRQCETDFAPKVVSSEHPQPEHQKVPVKNCAENVRLQLCWLNARDVKRYGSALHPHKTLLLQKS